MIIAGESIKLKLPPESMNVEVYKILKKFDIKTDIVLDYLRLFASLSGTERSGYLSEADFGALHGTCDRKLVKQLFREFDHSHGRKVSFRDFLIACAIMNRQSGKNSNLNAAKFAYNVISLGGTETKKEVFRKNILSLSINEKICESFLSQCTKGDDDILPVDFVSTGSLRDHEPFLDAVTAAFKLTFVKSEKVAVNAE